ncbi:uncharacterized protein LOC143603039 [Bidens hawaiensis]|uniref:uncharacterized protein LOC143603039 n=1 Tax=Bidens hawaiensis TaxID=980011 RepID=UPI00404AAE3F
MDGNRYKLWRRIFKDLCISAKVQGHLDGPSVPINDKDVDWFSMDAKIKSWFYNTCEPDLLQIIIAYNCTAKVLWDTIAEFFLNHRMSRMLQLQDTFRNTKKGTMSITMFCHHLKSLADSLADVDSPIADQELVMQILRQLPSPGYTAIVDVITNKEPFPTFLEAKNMLLYHESRDGLSNPPNDGLQNTTTALY